MLLGNTLINFGRIGWWICFIIMNVYALSDQLIAGTAACTIIILWVLVFVEAYAEKTKYESNKDNVSFDDIHSFGSWFTIFVIGMLSIMFIDVWWHPVDKAMGKFVSKFLGSIDDDKR